MDPETPKYMRPTRASLGRLTPKVKTPTFNEKIEARKLQQQRQLIRVRIESAEKLRQLVPPSERWPTVNSVRAYRANPFKTATKLDTGSQQPSLLSVGNTASALATQQPAISPSNFPFPIRSARDLSCFPQFGLLPTELRLQVWEQAVLNPKFIEIQYYIGPSCPRIVNHRRYDPLYSVCKESRDVAQALALNPDVRIMSRVRLFSPRYHLPATSNPQPAFVPERDTLFFRPMDHSLDNRVQALSLAFLGLHQIEHLAIPLDIKRPIPHSIQWASDMSDRFCLKLKTLTFMLGCEEKSWLGDASIELRDLEQWCVDGRRRMVKINYAGWVQLHEDRSPFDISELSGRMVAEDERRYRRVRAGRKPLKVRVVAWKRKV